MDRHQETAQLLLSARRDPTQRLNELPEILRPRTPEQAYLVQRSVMRELGEIGGWKVGASPNGDHTCAPLPARDILASPATASCDERGVEAEIGVRIGANLPHRDQPYSLDEVLAAIGSAHPTIEVLQSRYVDVTAIDRLSNLADSMSFHALVVGPAIPAWHDIDLKTESVRVLIDGAEVKRATGHPSGGMLPLLVWLANTGARWAGGLRTGQVVTTGSFTGKDIVPAGSTARMVFDHCGEVSVSFAP